MSDDKQIAEAHVQAIGGGVTVSDPPLVQVSVDYVREHLDAIGATLAAGGIVRIIDGGGNNLWPDKLPEDVASMVAAAKLSHESRRVMAGTMAGVSRNVDAGI